MNGETFRITKYEKGSHIPALDGIRGFAVLLVILFHFFSVGIGWLGVDVFFVLSGFLITGILIDAKGQKRYFSGFYARRTLRIFPLYYFALGVFFLFLHFSDNKLYLKNPFWMEQNMHWFFLYMQNWLFAFKGWPADHALNHFWSLAIEEQFYLFWPLVIFLVPLRNLPAAALLLALLSLFLRYYTFHAGYTETPVQYTVTFCRLDGLSFGALAAIYIRRNPGLLSRFLPWIFIITIPLSVFLYMMAHTLKYDNYYYVTAGYTVFDLFWTGILISCFAKGLSVIKRFFSFPVLMWLGKYSYGIYVYHWMIYQLLHPWFKSYFDLPDSIYQFLYGLICLLLTLGLSKLSYDYFERPLLKLKRKFN